LVSRLLNTWLGCPGPSVKRELAGSAAVCRSSRWRGLSISWSEGLSPLLRHSGVAAAALLSTARLRTPRQEAFRPSPPALQAEAGRLYAGGGRRVESEWAACGSSWPRSVPGLPRGACRGSSVLFLDNPGPGKLVL